MLENRISRRQFLEGTGLVVVASLVGCDTQTGSIDLSRLPKDFPQKVERHEEAVVEIRTPLDKHYGGATGVFIGDRHVLTAGHVLRTKDNEPRKDYTDRDLVLEGHNDGSVFEVSVVKSFSSYKGDGSIPDIAILETKYFPDIPPVKPGKKDIELGQEVLFVNYEPALDGKDRKPSAWDTAYTKPARYGGKIISRMPNETFIAVTGLADYGDGISDDSSRAGSSGGPVFNTDGKLLGLSTRAETRRTFSVSELEKAFEVRLNGVSEAKKLSFSVIEPITPKTIVNLRKKLH